MAGIRIDTLHGNRGLSEISVFVGKVSGGTAQVNPGGGLEKISGVSGYNTGGSSVQFIEGNSDGYFQFQLAQAPVRVGLTYQDVDFEDITPFRLVLNFNGSAFIGGTQALGPGGQQVGDFFRIRHYAATNTVQFQKRQEIFDTDGSSLGQDFVSFHTHSTLTNGNDLFFDVSLQNIGCRINDTIIVT